MENLGYVSVSEAEKLTGVKVGSIAKQCRDGKCKWALRRRGIWYVPRSELIKLPNPGRDEILNGLIYASRLGLELPITMLVGGIVLSGRLTSIREYLLQCRDGMYADINDAADDQQDEQTVAKRRLVDEVLKGVADIEIPYDKLFANVADDPDILRLLLST